MSSQKRSDEAQSIIRADTPYPAMLLIGRLDATAGAVASFDFQNIPATFSKLLVDLFARGDTAAREVAVRLAINGDGGANYDYTCPYVTGNTWYSNHAVGVTSIYAGTIAAATAPANTFDGLIVHIPGYASSVANKVCFGQSTAKVGGTAALLYQYFASGWWYPAAPVAINRLTLTPGAGNFAQYSTARLYGVV